MSEFNDIQSDFPVILEQPISWGDMDAYGHVNNTRYFRYFEDARIAYLEGLKVADNATLLQFGIVVASATCKFKSPLTYPDRIRIGARISRLDESRFVMQYAIASQKQDRIVATGETLMVSFDLATQSKVELPETVQNQIRNFEKTQI